MPRTAQQHQRARDATRKRILRHAMRLFAQHGYAAVSVRMLAVEANMAVGLLYRHFPSQQAVLVALFQESMVQVRGTFMAATTGATPAQRIQRLMEAAVETTQRNRDFWRLSYSVRHQPAVTRALGKQLTAWTTEIIHVLTRQFSDAGVPHPDIEARVLFATLDGVCQHLALAPRTYPVDRVIRTVMTHYHALLEPR